MRNPRLMAVLAHPDDESLGVGGTLAKYASAGVEVFLITATRGDSGRFRGYRLGDHHHRRGLPHLHLRQGLIPIGGNALERRTQAQEFGERDDDVMNDTARRSKTIGHSAMGQEPKARPLDREPRVVGLHQGQRTQSAPTGRTYDRRPPAVHRRNKNACQGAVHI